MGKSRKGKTKLYFGGVKDPHLNKYLERFKRGHNVKLCDAGAFGFNMIRPKRGNRFQKQRNELVFPEEFTISSDVSTIIIPVVFDDNEYTYTEKEKTKGVCFGHVAVVGVSIPENKFVYFDNRLLAKGVFTIFRRLVQEQLKTKLERELGVNLQAETWKLGKQQHNFQNGCGLVAAKVIEALLHFGGEPEKWSGIELPKDKELYYLMEKCFPYYKNGVEIIPEYLLDCVGKEE